MITAIEAGDIMYTQNNFAKNFIFHIQKKAKEKHDTNSNSFPVAKRNKKIYTNHTSQELCLEYLDTP